VSVLGERGTGGSLLVRLGFADRVATEAALVALGLWRDGRPVDDEAAALVTAAADVADPDLAVAALARLLEAVEDPDELRAAVCGQDGFRARLLGVLGTSVALGDHLAAHPADWHVLVDDEQLAARPSAYGLQTALLAAVGAPAGEPPPWGSGGARAGLPVAEAVDRLRTAYRRCVLALAARDVVGALGLEDVAGELADLAGATLSAAMAVALSTLPEGAAPCRLAVVGMGKAGGRELNYVSDVDVIFVGAPLDDGDDDPALRTATKLAAETMRVCGLVAWPVDAGLRPEGAAGPLVRTLASHAAYYRRWAQTWEFQALLKARPIAGDLELGRAFTDLTSPLVWSVSERKGFVEDVQAMRRRVEKTLKADRADREVKLGRGGLRDVEFAVQLLQLVHGRTDESLRSGTTIPALEALAHGGYVGREDARHLAEAYRWLRTVEHRLQLHRLRRTHLLPAADDEEGLRRVAARPATGGTPSRRSPASGPATAGRSAGCTRSCSTGRCSAPWRGCPASRSRSRRRRRGPGSRRSASPSRPSRCASCRPSPRGSRAGPRSSRRCCRPCSTGSPALPTPTPGCWPSARCPTSSARRPGTCGCCATRAGRPSGWPRCWPPRASSATCSAGRPRRSGCWPTTRSCSPGRGRP
jgi:glutamate-ammonia-ligase adenylyltransferase